MFDGMSPDSPDSPDSPVVGQIPRWVSKDKLWERFSSAPLLLQLCVAQLLDRDTIERVAGLQLENSWQIDVTNMVDRGRGVLRPTLTIH